MLVFMSAYNLYSNSEEIHIHGPIKKQNISRLSLCCFSPISLMVYNVNNNQLMAYLVSCTVPSIFPASTIQIIFEGNLRHQVTPALNILLASKKLKSGFYYFINFSVG